MNTGPSSALGNWDTAGEVSDVEAVTVRALKYPDRPHYEWTSRVAERSGPHLVCTRSPGSLVHHTKGKVFPVACWGVEFFTSSEWFTVHVDIAPSDGAIEQIYCNIACPAVISRDSVTFVDLDLDLVRGRDADWQVLDEDEFEANRRALAYPDAFVREARRALEELRERIRAGAMPFDGTLDRHIQAVREEMRQG